jgi:hypothetical protein
MKKIMVKYTMEISENKFDKYCRRVMLTKKKAIVDLRDLAEASGRVMVYGKVENTLEAK